MTEAHHVFVDGSCVCHRFLAVAFFDATTGEARAMRLKKHGNFYRAEIEAIKFALNHFKNNGVRKIAIYSDNKLAVAIFNNRQKAPRRLKKLCKYVKRLARKYEKVSFTWQPREQNFEANRRAQLENGIPPECVH